MRQILSILLMTVVVFLTGCNSTEQVSPLKEERSDFSIETGKVEAIYMGKLTAVNSEWNKQDRAIAEINELIYDEDKINEIVRIMNDLKMEPIYKQAVMKEELHLSYEYTLSFFEDIATINEQDTKSFWLYHNGTIVHPTWGNTYYITRHSEHVNRQLIEVLETNLVHN